MMEQQMKDQIKNLIEQTNGMFMNCGGVNTDFADFATIALADFRTLLNEPDMTDRELKQLIRRAAARHKAAKSKDCWKSFTARYMSRKANNNSLSTIQ